MTDLLSTGLDICVECDDEQRWDIPIEATLAAEFPEITPDNLKLGLPANHPYWSRRHELWEKHKQPCAVFAYDDASVALCATHLRALAAKLEP